MKLRTFILGKTLIVVIAVLIISSVQIAAILSDGFNQLAAQQLQKSTEYMKAFVRSRFDYLTSYAQYLSRGDGLVRISEAYLKTNDEREIRKKLERIRIDNRFNVAELLINQKLVSGNQFPLNLSALHEAEEGKVVIFPNRVNGTIGLTAYTGLYDGKKRLGILIIGYAFDKKLENRLSELTTTHATFGLRDKDFELITSRNGDVHFQEYPLFNAQGAYLVAHVEEDRTFINGLNYRIRKNLSFSGALSLCLVALFVFIFFDLASVAKFTKILKTVSKAANDLKRGKINQIYLPEQNRIKEMDLLAGAFNDFSKSLVDYDRKMREQAQEMAEAKEKAAVADLAQQVAHDIRSPLSALGMFAASLKQLPEETRIAIRDAVSRITDISNTLIQRSKSNEVQVESGERTSQLLSGVIEALITEKRVEYASKSGIRIDFEADKESYGLFSEINSVEFKRVLSNLINNAVEAISQEGTVSIHLSRNGENAVIEISDSGNGIPSDLLPELGARGLSVGKIGGMGLGLFHARTTVESWGGILSIDSRAGEGTTIGITLTSVAAPPWFVESLKIPIPSTIVVIDDDASVHQVWNMRFIASNAPKNSIKLLHFKSPDELAIWHRKHHELDVLYLCDFEFIGHAQNGLKVIESMGIRSQSVLVTSRHEDPKVLEGCERLGIKLIPKNLAGFVPIIFKRNKEGQEEDTEVV
jgi:signal transduction histidine kinase